MIIPLVKSTSMFSGNRSNRQFVTALCIHTLISFHLIR